MQVDRTLGWIVVVVVAAWWLTGLDAAPAPAAPDLARFEGTWADASGHRLRLWFERGEPSRTVLGEMVAQHGWFESHGVVAEGTHTARWNFGSFDPLVLNMALAPDEERYAQIAFTARGMRIRAGSDPEAAMEAGFLDSPLTLVLSKETTSADDRPQTAPAGEGLE